jgi:hypothetical protein
MEIHRGGRFARGVKLDVTVISLSVASLLAFTDYFSQYQA